MSVVAKSVLINKAHFPVTTLGYGQRIGVWFQGCSIRCSGCLSKDTWETDARFQTSVDQLWDTIQHWLPHADGVTFSGGEPLDQPDALGAILRRLKEHAFPGDILLFSGYPLEFIEERHTALLNDIDVLIADPYREDAGQSMPLRGSDNQRAIRRTPLAMSRYPENLDLGANGHGRALDIQFDGGKLWVAGIPRPGTLRRLKELLASRGFSCHTSDQPELTIRS